MFRVKRREGASPVDTQAKSFPGREKSKCKAPQVKASLICSKNSKEANNAGDELAKKRLVGGEVRDVKGAQIMQGHLL